MTTTAETAHVITDSEIGAAELQVTLDQLEGRTKPNGSERSGQGQSDQGASADSSTRRVAFAPLATSQLTWERTRCARSDLVWVSDCVRIPHARGSRPPNAGMRRLHDHRRQPWPSKSS